MQLPSKTRINKCGEIVRAARFEPGYELDAEALSDALDVVKGFRRAHQEPMAKVRNGLTSMVNTLGYDPVIAQRLKRAERIIRKLDRSVGSDDGRTDLARLEDIGGVRVILPDQEADARARIGVTVDPATVKAFRDACVQVIHEGYYTA